MPPKTTLPNNLPTGVAQSMSQAPTTQQTVENADQIVEESKKTQAYNAEQNKALPKLDTKLTRRPVKKTDGSLYYQVLDKKGNVIGYEDINGKPIENPVDSGPSKELVELANDKANEMKVSDSVSKINAEKAAGSAKYDTKESLMAAYDSDAPDAINWDNFYNRMRNLNVSDKEIYDIVVQNGYDKKYKKAGEWAAQYAASIDPTATNSNINANTEEGDLNESTSGNVGNNGTDTTVSGGEGNTEEGNTEEGLNTETESNPVEQQGKDAIQRKWQTRSVWQAWKDGEFGDPNTKDAKQARNYFLLNSLATFAQNAAERSANLANVYRGGQADASVGQNKSEWSNIQEARRQNALENELSSASALDTAGTNQTIAENYNASEQYGQQQSNEAQKLQNDYQKIINKYADKTLENQLKLSDKQIEQLEKLNKNQDIQNQILSIESGYTSKKADELLKQIEATVDLTSAQKNLLEKQVDWYDANEGMAALTTFLKLLTGRL